MCGANISRRVSAGLCGVEAEPSEILTYALPAPVSRAIFLPVIRRYGPGPMMQVSFAVFRCLKPFYKRKAKSVEALLDLLLSNHGLAKRVMVRSAASRTRVVVICHASIPKMTLFLGSLMCFSSLISSDFEPFVRT